MERTYSVGGQRQGIGYSCYGENGGEDECYTYVRGMVDNKKGGKIKVESCDLVDKLWFVIIETVVAVVYALSIF